MDELFDALLDAICDFFGIEKRRGKEPGIFRWILRVIWKLFLLLFSFIALLLSVFQIRPRSRRRRHWFLWPLLLIVIDVGALAAWYIHL